MATIGTKKNDVLGPNFDDRIVKGKGGNDTLAGSSDSDTLIGGKGNDTLIGAGSADILKGGPGKDVFVVSYGDTILDFKPGVDKIVVVQPFNQIALVGDTIYTHDASDHTVLIPIAETIGHVPSADDLLNV